MTKELKIVTPLTDEVLAGIHAGDRLFISGTLYTARDAAHARLVKTLDEGKPLPFDVKGQIIYFVGPTPARPGKVIGAAGPTTSYRMDAYSPHLIAQGLKGMIGKGARSQEVRDAMVKYKAIYCAATGGAAALLSKRIVKAEIIAYEELGPEAIRRLEVKDFPVIVINDIYGSDQYEQARKEYAQPSKYF
jgi:fumarate hydratase subunit beta